MLLKLKNVYKNISVVKKATIWFLICSILQKGIAFFTTPIFTRLMTTEQYGEYSLYLTWFQVLLLITSFRLDFAVFNKGMSKFEDEKDKYTLTMQTFTTIITIIFFVIYLVIAKQINRFTNLTTELTVLIFINVLFMNAVSFWTIKQRYNFKYKSVVAVTLILSVISTILGVILVIFTENKGLFRILSIAIVQILVGIIIYVYNILKGKVIFEKKYAKFAFLFNLPLIPHYLSMYILEQSDKIMIQKMAGVDKLGIYSVVYSIGNAITIFTNSLTQALTPWLYRELKKNNVKEIKNKVSMMYLFSTLMIVMFVLFIPEVLRVIASSEYYEAVYVSATIAVSMLFSLIYGIFATVEFYYDKNKFSMIISGIVAILNMILNYFGIKLFGYQAAGYTSMVCYGILCIGHSIYANKLANSKTNEYVASNKMIIGIVLTMCIFAFSCLIIYQYTILRISLIILFFVIILFNKNKIKNLISSIKK